MNVMRDPSERCSMALYLTVGFLYIAKCGEPFFQYEYHKQFFFLFYYYKAKKKKGEAVSVRAHKSSSMSKAPPRGYAASSE